MAVKMGKVRSMIVERVKAENARNALDRAEERLQRWTTDLEGVTRRLRELREGGGRITGRLQDETEDFRRTVDGLLGAVEDLWDEVDAIVERVFDTMRSTLGVHRTAASNGGRRGRARTTAKT